MNRSLQVVGLAILIFAVAAFCWYLSSASWNIFFAASGWLGLLAKIVLEEIRLGEAQHLQQQQRLLEYAHQLNGPPHSGLAQLYLLARSGDKEAQDNLKRTDEEFAIDNRLELAGMLESVFLESEYGQISYNDIDKLYGELVIALADDTIAWSQSKMEIGRAHV